jgi:hypothetical protein
VCVDDTTIVVCVWYDSPSAPSMEVVVVKKKSSAGAKDKPMKYIFLIPDRQVVVDSGGNCVCVCVCVCERERYCSPLKDAQDATTLHSWDKSSWNVLP